jgi:predicted RNase H-like nuclease (RuvC/YqgF family)
MSFKRVLVAAVAMLAFSGVGRLLAQAQEALSLGDLARQQKAQRAKAARKPVKEFSNDNLPARPATAGLTVAGEMSAEPQATKSGESEGTEAAEAAKQPAGGEAEAVHDEKYYRDEMSKLQARLETHRRQLSVLEQKLAQGDMQYYPDPQRTLEQTSTPSFRSDINKLQDDIAKKKQDIADDERAIEDLRDQLRREGSPPGWLR